MGAVFRTPRRPGPAPGRRGSAEPVCRFGENGARECPLPRRPLRRAAPAGRPARPGAGDPAALGGRQGLRPHAGGFGGQAAVGLLRGAAHRQRPAGHAPHRGPRVQGRLPPVQDHAGLARPPPGRLGLPRPAGRDRRRAGARLRRQARHRALRHRRVQRPLPGVGRAARRLVLRAHPAHGLLGRHVHGLLDDGPRLHRERLVVAQADLREGPAGRGPPRRALLPALRHRAVRPRGRPGLRDPHRPLGLRAAAGHQRRVGRQGRPADLDDDAVDAAVEHRRRDAPRRHLRRRPPRRHRRRHLRRRRAAADRRPGRGRRGPRPHAGPRLGAGDLPAAVRARGLPRTTTRTTSSSPTTSPPRTAPAWCTSPPPSAPTTSPSRRGYGMAVVNPIDATGHFLARRAAGRRALLQGRRRRAGRGPEEARRPAAGSCATSTAIRTAGAATRRSCTTRSRPGTSAPARSRTSCSPRTRRRTGTPRTSRPAATATG